MKIALFDQIVLFIQDQVQIQYGEILDKFFSDTVHVLNEEERSRLCDYLKSEFMKSEFMKSEFMKSGDEKTNLSRMLIDHFLPLSQININLDLPSVRLNFNQDSVSLGGETILPRLRQNRRSNTTENLGTQQDITKPALTIRKRSLAQDSLLDIPEKQGDLPQLDNTKCRARTSLGIQCARAHGDHPDLLCGSHRKLNPYGLIGETNPLEDAKKEKKYQSIYKSVKNLKNVDLSAYIKTTELELNGKTFLLDENGILYDQFTFTITAIIKDNKVYWYT